MPGQNLRRDEAQQRASVISKVGEYTVALDLTTGEETFATTTTVTFSAAPGAATFADFIGQSVERIELNGTELDPAKHFVDSRIELPELAAENTLTVEATGVYMHTGEGLHRFVDPADGEVYLYTQFETADARRMFVTFEQPDLKASYQFTVTAPAHWQVISNEPTPEPEPVRDGVATWVFAPTARISTYLTALIAGPYVMKEDSVTTGGRQMPLRVFCRASLEEHLEADVIFDLTKKGFAYFEKEFAVDYPFTKYDQIFAPEYNAGAMENVGAVTFTEHYIFRGATPRSRHADRAETVLHELAHMWFGNLVTMKWWDDLWLNESFATWTSNAAMAEATEYTDAWTMFALATKAWGYEQDQLSSTHPIGADMVDLETVEANFDGITYAKGASVLKQLAAYVGRDAFREALRTYFRKYAWGNTEFDNLLDELSAASGRDMLAWAQSWLRTASVNILRPVVDVAEDGTYRSVVVEQSALPGYDTLRPHRMGIGLYSLEGDTLRRTEYVEVDVDGERTDIAELVGKKQPDLLLLNDEDHAFAKIRLDERSLATALAHADRIEDSLARALVLGACWDMVRDAELGATDYLGLALRRLALEEDASQLDALSHNIDGCLAGYCDPAKRPENTATVAAAYRALLEAPGAGHDAQLIAVRGLTVIAPHPDHAQLLRELLDGTRVIDGYEVDQDQRWALLTGLARLGQVDADEVEAERGRDKSANGNEKALTVLAARPTAAAKAEAWRRAHDEELPNSQVRSLAAGFMRGQDTGLFVPYLDKYFTTVEDVWETKTFAIAATLLRGFYPTALANQELLDATNAWLDEHADAASGARRIVAEGRDMTQRRVNAQQRDAR